MAGSQSKAAAKSSSNTKSKSKPKSNANAKRTSTLKLETLGSSSNIGRLPSATQNGERKTMSLVTPPLFSSASFSQSPVDGASTQRNGLRRSLSVNVSDPEAMFSAPSNTRSASTSSRKSVKGKEKQTIVVSSDDDGAEELEAPLEFHSDRLLIDAFTPETVDNLAVQKKKVDEVRQWLLEAFEGGLNGTLKKYRRILALTGASGSGKSTTIRVLAKEMGYEVVEWVERPNLNASFEFDEDMEGLSERFDTFLNRASRYSSLFSPSGSPSASHLPSTSSILTHTQSSPPKRRRRLILLEEFPTLSHPNTRDAFHAALQRFTMDRSCAGTPLVIVVSDEGYRGMAAAGEEKSGGFRFAKVDVRSVLPAGMLGGLYCNEIKFNPIASTLMKKSLQNLIWKTQDSKLRRTKLDKLDKESLDKIVEASNGDLRSAIMSLELLDMANRGEVNLPNGKSSAGGTGKNARSRGKKDKRSQVEIITQRENSLALFHLLGKVLYNKRKADPSQPSASAKDIKREKEIDDALLDLPPLPSWLSHEERKRSRVDVEMLYSDSPIDASLYSLYLHQNYPKFCESEEQCFSICDWLSYVDAASSVRGDSYSWQTQTNPHQFHLITLGVLHSLPSPVPRRSQKMFKPSFFEWNTKEKEARAAVMEVGAWLDDKRCGEVGEGGGGWNLDEVACEMGAVLRVRSRGHEGLNVPRSHTFFSELKFSSLHGEAGGEIDQDGGDVTLPIIEDDADAEGTKTRSILPVEVEKGWLEDDEIEDENS